LAVVYAALCLTHILSGFMVGITIGTVELVYLIRYRTWSQLRVFLGITATLGLGAALAGAYLVPALLAYRYASPQLLTTDPTYDWQNYDWHRTFAFAVVTALLYGVRWKLYQYAVAAIVVLPFAVGVGRWVMEQKKDEVETRLLAAGAVAIFFAIELSAPIWALLQPLQFLQFCYRFLAPASVLGLMTCAWRLGRSARHEAVVTAVMVASLLSLAGLEVKLAAEGYIFSFDKLEQEQLFGEVSMRPAVQGPEWRDYGRSGGFAGECARLGLTCTVLQNRPQSRRWRITVSNKATSPVIEVRLPAFAFPTWSVVINDVEQKRAVDPATGAIVARLTARDNLVELRWTPLMEERLGWLATAIAAILLIALTSPLLRSRSDHAGER
jgi:hypothetical protein